MNKRKQLDDFKFFKTIDVAWGDMDALGHVNNSVYFKYFESARIAYFQAISLFSLFNLKETGPVLSKTSCRYLLPVFFPDQLNIGVKTIIENDYLLKMEYLAENSEKSITTIGEAEIVFYSFKEQKKIKISEEIKKNIEAIEL